MTVDPDFAKQIVDLVDGDTWLLADRIAEEFPADQWGGLGDSSRSGLHAELKHYEIYIRDEYGVEIKSTTMRDYRMTAIAWPRALRNAGVSFMVHRRIRGAQRQTEMAKRLAQARREKQALSVKMLARLRADERPPSLRSPQERMHQAITNAVRRELLAGIATKRDDWWMASGITDEARAVVVRELRRLANAINKGSADD